MKITIKLLEKWGACSSGKDYFTGKFPTGADYSNVIAQCDEDGQQDYHQWLFNRAFQHLEAKELGEIAQGEAAQTPIYVKKGLEPLALLKEELKDTDTVSKEDKARLAASGNSSQLAASGNSSQLAASGDSSQLAASGDSSRLAASGDSSRLAASGNSSQLAASGDSSQLAASGDSSQLAASGNSSRLAASGDSSQLAASGDSSRLAASGDSSQLAASGDSSQLAASGDSSQLAASGDSSQLAASGDSSQLAASGYYSQLAASGENSIIASAAFGTTFKLGAGGCAAIPYKDESDKTRFAVAYVGENIEADTFYSVNAQGKFIKVDENDNA